MHARGIIHCDVKPANLLRTADGIVKLTDFGLCRLAGSSKRSAPWKQLAGTPHYMSPEQCREEECDERTDVYSLGATYYTLLTGRTPYADATPLRSCSRIVRRLCPTRVTCGGGSLARAPRSSGGRLAKKRADRYGSARECLNALRAVLLGRSKP